MAMNTQSKTVTVKEGAGESGQGGAPAWVAGLFFGGLVLLYLGRRVLLQPSAFTAALSVGAVLLLLLSTVIRLLPRFRGSSDHARVAWLTAGLQGLALVAVGLHFLSGDRGLELLGAESAEKEQSVRAVLQIVWILTLTVSAAALTFAEIALHPMRRAARVEVARVRAAALSGAILALAAGYGSLSVYAASQSEAQIDFSYFKTSQPGEATVKLLQKMADPVRVTGFFPEVSEVRKEVNGYLEQLKAEAGNVDVELVDRYLRPKLAKELKVVRDGSIVIQRDGAQKVLQVGTELSSARGKLKTLDKDFYGQLLKLLRSRRTAYLTTGHGELNDPQRGAEKAEGREARLLKKILEKQNYLVKDLGLGQGLATAVPEDATMVLVLGPTLPLSPEEMQTLKRYADGGGKLLYALDVDGVAIQDFVGGSAQTVAAAAPTSSATARGKKPGGGAPPPPGVARETGAGVATRYGWLVQLARTVGADYVPTLVADAAKHVPRRRNPSDHALLFTNRFSSHASVSTLSRNSARAAVVLSAAGHLRKLDQGKVRSDVTLRSYSSAFEDVNGNFQRDAQEKAESFNLGMAYTLDLPPLAGEEAEAKAPDVKEVKDTQASDTKAPDSKVDQETEAPEPRQMRAFVLADADVFSDLLLSNFPSNQMLAFDALRWLGGEESLAGELTTEEDVRIEHTKQKDLVWFYAIIFGIPVSVLGVGLIVSRTRRKGARG